MILKEVIDLSKNISNHRSDMYEMVKNKGLSDPDVIKISQKLDLEILNFQNIINKLRSS